MPRKKKLTKREIAENRKIKKMLQEEGLLPPDKPRLNRKKFAQEVCEEWEEFSLADIGQLIAFSTALEMMTNTGRYDSISKEDLGILKLKKSAMVLYKALEENKGMTYGEIIDLLTPIWKL